MELFSGVQPLIKAAIPKKKKKKLLQTVVKLIKAAIPQQQKISSDCREVN